VSTPATELRRRVMGWRAAERREHELRRLEGPLAPTVALETAFELHDLFAGTLDRQDAVRVRELTGARAAWRKLRERLACPPAVRMPL
jgi:hypothetical protein